MDKEKFLKELAFLLSDISDEEKDEAILYYQDYFDEAGKENESQVINELQSPERVAALIKAGLNSTFESDIEYSESGMGNSNYNRPYEVVTHNEEKVSSNSDNNEKKPYNFHGDPKRNKILIMVLIAFIVVCASPLLGGGFGLFIGFIAIIFALGIFLGAMGFTTMVVAIISIVHGISIIFKYPGAGLVSIGTGVVLVGVSTLLFKSVKGALSLAPLLFKGIIDICKKIINKVGEII